MMATLDGARKPWTAEKLWPLVVHLRLHFQLLLAPVFLWGWLVAGGGWSASILIAFLAFHVFLYAGATAFNSYYDRDQGPVGGLEHPPAGVSALLPVSLGIQLAGWLLAALVNLPFFLIYAAFGLLSIAYSHPRLRLKARPLASLATVALGQGVLAYLGAWAAARGELSSALSPLGILGATAATLLILALYPLSQLYQIQEDGARGDRTPAVAWGAPRCFQIALACQLIGGTAMLSVVARRDGPLDALIVGLGLAAQLAAVAWWARHHDPRDVLGSYHRVMRLNALSASGLSAYLLLRLVQP